MKRESSFGKQFLLTLADNKYWFELSIARKQAAAGQDARFIVLARDISERKRMEVSVQESERQFRALQRTRRKHRLYDCNAARFI